MRVNDDFEKWNAAHQINDENSVHAFWKRALVFRKQHDVLVRFKNFVALNNINTCPQTYGDFEDISLGDERVFAFVRCLGSTKALVVLNFKEEDVEFTLDAGRDWSGYTLRLGSYGDDAGDGDVESGKVLLQGYEGRVYVTL